MLKMIFFGVLIVLMAGLWGHPPSDIDITFGSEDSILTVYVAHRVANPNNHYIDRVIIELDGNEIIDHQISRQDDGDGVLLEYRLPDTKTGMVLNVITTCNRYGSLSKEIEIQ